MTERTFDSVRGDLKRLLEDRRDDGWVFGVCATIARRSGWELWAVRAAAVVLLLLSMFWAGVAYFVLAMLFHETRPGAQRKLVRWARRADDALEILLRGLRNIVKPAPTAPPPPPARHAPPPTDGDAHRAA